MHAAAQRRLYLGDRIALGGGDGLLLSLVDACLVFEVERVPRLLVQKVVRPSNAQDETASKIMGGAHSNEREGRRLFKGRYTAALTMRCPCHADRNLHLLHPYGRL